MKNTRRIAAVLFIVLTCLGCDQATKLVASHHLSRSVPLTFLGDSIRFQYVENLGAFLSLGAGLSPSIRVAVFLVGVSVILAGLLFYVLRASRVSRYEVLAAALLLAIHVLVAGPSDRSCGARDYSDRLLGSKKEREAASS